MMIWGVQPPAASAGFDRVVAEFGLARLVRFAPAMSRGSPATAGIGSNSSRYERGRYRSGRAGDYRIPVFKAAEDAIEPWLILKFAPRRSGWRRKGEIQSLLLDGH